MLSVSVQFRPNIVYVLPEPVCPYANIVALMPLVTESMEPDCIITGYAVIELLLCGG